MSSHVDPTTKFLAGFDAQKFYHRTPKEIVPCNLCGSKDLANVVRGDRYGMGLRTVMCRRCGLFFTNPRPVQDALRQFYTEHYRPLYCQMSLPQEGAHSDTIASNTICRRAKWQFDFVRPHLEEICDSVPVVLGVGCGEGAFLKQVRSAFPRSRLFGIEPTHEYAKFAAEDIQAEVFVGDVDDFVRERKGRKGDFDLILLSHVLEHLHEPVRTVHILKEFLKDDGLIYIEVPNLASPHWRGLRMFHIAHLYHFTPRTLRLLFDECEIEVVRELKWRHPVNAVAMAFVGRKSGKRILPKAPPSLSATAADVLLKSVQRQALVRKGLRMPTELQRGRIRRQALDLLRKPLGLARRVLVGPELNRIKDSIKELSEKQAALASRYDLLVSDSRARWLFKNRVERMDATVELFAEGRRAFHLARYEFACPYVLDKTVADIACGTGYGTELLAVKGKAKRAIGVDIDPETIDYARSTHMKDGVEFVCAPGDSTRISSESVDVVVSFETIEHVPSDDDLLKEFHRILRPGGILICSTPNDWPVESSPFHVRTYNRRSFETALAAYFDEITLYNQNSGSDFQFNRLQPAGIAPTTGDNESTAECYIAACRKSGRRHSSAGAVSC